MLGKVRFKWLTVCFFLAVRSSTWWTTGATTRVESYRELGGVAWPGDRPGRNAEPSDCGEALAQQGMHDARK